MDEQALEMAAMEQALGAAGGMDPMGDPMAMEGGSGYTPVMVPDAVLPAVMELVAQAEGGAGAPGMGGGMPPEMGMPF
jgi:hypothetical protein